MQGCCDCGNEQPAAIKCGEFVNSLWAVSFTIKTVCPWM